MMVVVGVWEHYLGEGKGVGHGADKDLTQLPIEVGALDPVQVGVHPKNPGKRKVRSRLRLCHQFSCGLTYLIQEPAEGWLHDRVPPLPLVIFHGTA